ncbi:hypothetical protein ABPG72_001664 [Tetrahymena utriculariae]
MKKAEKYFSDLEEFLNSPLQTLTSIHIDLTENDLGDEGISKLSEGLLQCANLQVLLAALRDNSISDEAMLTLSSSLAQCKNLNYLVLQLECFIFFY